MRGVCNNMLKYFGLFGPNKLLLVADRVVISIPNSCKNRILANFSLYNLACFGWIKFGPAQFTYNLGLMWLHQYLVQWSVFGRKIKETQPTYFSVFYLGWAKFGPKNLSDQILKKKPIPNNVVHSCYGYTKMLQDVMWQVVIG